jgi:hypothetical protein
VIALCTPLMIMFLVMVTISIIKINNGLYGFRVKSNVDAMHNDLTLSESS